MEESPESRRGVSQSHYKIHFRSVCCLLRDDQRLNDLAGLDFPLHSTRAIVKNEALEVFSLRSPSVLSYQ